MFNYENAQRIYIPGDRWLYFEIYTSPLISDSLITNEIYESASSLIDEKVISKWHFIRFNKPGYHLRVRFELQDNHPVDYIIELLNSKLRYHSANGFLHEISINTYQREIERYGNTTINNAENIFYEDSIFISKMLREKTIRSGKARWLAGIKNIDQLLNDFNLNLDEKKSVLFNLNRSFGREFKKGPSQAKLISSKYRKHRTDIYDIIENDCKEYRKINKLLEKRSENISIDIEQIEFLSNLYLLEQPLENLLTSFIHMSLNRLFPTNHRFNEMILYDFLFRYYKSKVAREKYDR